jgi:Xaa-Pro dipeptidase
MRKITPALGFSLEEYATRITRVCTEMNRRRVDALCTYALDNIYYLSGYDGTIGGYLYTCLLLTADGTLTLLVHEVDHGTALWSTWVDDIRIWKHGEVPEDVTLAIIRERGLEQSVIGLEEDALVMSITTDRALRAGLQRAAFVNCSDLIARLRWVLSPAEIVYMRQSAGHGDAGTIAGYKAIRPGATEQDVAKAVTDEMYAQRSARWTSVFCMGSGDKSVALHSFPGPRRLATGDLITLVPHADMARYVTSIHRTASVGRASEFARELHSISMEAILRSVDAIKPGVPAGEIDRISREVTQRFDRYRCHRTGFSMGIAFGYGFKCMPKLSVLRGVEVELEAGMVLSIEPNFQDLDHNIGILLGNNYLVTETGCESLHKLPLDLFEAM